MLDIGFFELMMIALVGLFVIGPERLPATIRTCALWFGRIKRNLLDTRRELEKQIGADEIRRELQNEQVMHNIAKLKESRDELAKKIQDWKEEVVSDEHGDTELLEHDDGIDEYRHEDPLDDDVHDNPSDDRIHDDPSDDRIHDENDPYGDNLHHDDSTTDEPSEDPSNSRKKES